MACQLAHYVLLISFHHEVLLHCICIANLRTAALTTAGIIYSVSRGYCECSDSTWSDSSEAVGGGGGLLVHICDVRGAGRGVLCESETLGLKIIVKKWSERCKWYVNNGTKMLKTIGK